MAVEIASQKSTIVRTIRRTAPDRPMIRVLEPADVPLIEAMAGDLSTRSLYQRFFTGTPRIPRDMLRQLRAIDHVHQEAVVAMVAGRLVGLGQYVHAPGSDSAELAVLVVDTWQHKGVGRLLVTRLAELAARRGVMRFDASVLPDNMPARRAVARLWPESIGRQTADCVEYSLPLRATAVPRPVVSPVHRARRGWLGRPDVHKPRT